MNNGGTDIDLSTFYKNHWPQYQMVLLPQNNKIANNVIQKTSGTAIFTTVQDTASPLNTITFAPNVFEGNMIHGATVQINAPNVSTGYTISSSPLLALSNGLFRPTTNSPVIGSAVGSYVTVDMDGQTRTDGDIDSGADEVASSAITRKPLTSQDVGPLWMR
ncbi:hypothetical protein D3C73_749260 [compost metagenome]